MKQPARFLFATCLAMIIAAAANTTTAAEGEAPAQVLVQVDIPDQVMAAYWTKLPDAYVLRVVLEQPQPAPVARTESATANPLTIAEALTQLVPQNIATYTPVMTGAPPTMERGDRGSFFIGKTVADLRGENPAFSCRTLTLVDGRRVVAGGQQPAPARKRMPAQPDQPYYYLYQLATLTRFKDPRVDVWLLKADGTQILGAGYDCKYAEIDPAKPRRHLEVSYEFPLASVEQAVAAAIRIDDRYFIEKLQQPGR